MAQNIVLPAIQFLGNPLWAKVQWQGTTFRWHPSSASPPVMGLVFGDKEAASSLFRTWTQIAGNHDAFEELRVTIVEGALPGTSPGYIVHFCPDPDNTLAHATAEDLVIDLEQFAQYCRANKMDYLPNVPSMLARFRQEYGKHKEYLLAPVTKRDDGQLYVNVELGIIKREIHFTSAQQITDELKAKGLDLDRLHKLLQEQAGNPPRLS